MSPVADFAAVVHDGKTDDVSHLRHHVDHALELVRRVEEDRRSVDVAGVVLGVHHHPGGAPLPGHRVAPAGIPVDVPPSARPRSRSSTSGPAASRAAGLPRSRSGRSSPTAPRCRRPCPPRLHLGERGVVRVVVGDGDLDVMHRLELLDQLRIGVIAPVVDVELSRREGASRTRQQRRPGEGACQSSHRSLLMLASCRCVARYRLRLRAKNSVTENHAREQQDGGDRVHLRRHDPADLPQHVRREGLLPGGLHELRDHHVVGARSRTRA